MAPTATEFTEQGGPGQRTVRTPHACLKPTVLNDSALTSRFVGCLVGGATATGFHTTHWLRPAGQSRCPGQHSAATSLGTAAKAGPLSDFTQMTLLAASASLAAAVQAIGKGCRPCFRRAVAGHYLQWIGLNGLTFRGSEVEVSGWLHRHADLFPPDRESPACLRLLESLGRIAEGRRDGSGDGFGIGLVAPIAQFFAADPGWDRDPSAHGAMLLRTASDVASITDGHPGSRLTAGAFAVILAVVLRGRSVTDGIDTAKDVLGCHQNHAETLACIVWAQRAAAAFRAHPAVLRTLRTEHVAPRSLGFALYAALSIEHFGAAVRFVDGQGKAAANAALLTGHLIGARFGVAAIPLSEPKRSRAGRLLAELAEDLLRIGRCCDSVHGFRPARLELYRQKYPGI